MAQEAKVAEPRRRARTGAPPGPCPVRAAMAVLEHKWTMAIVMALLARTRRFTELAEATPGLNTRTLTERLRALETEGIVRRIPGETSRVAVRYALTEKGRELRGVIRSIRRWALRWEEEPAP